MAENYAECFCGWDLTVGLGYSDFHDHVTVTTVVNGPFTASFAAEQDQGIGSVAVQGKTGLNMGFWNRWVFGAEVYAQYNNADIIFILSDSLGNFLETQMELPVNFGVDIRLGYAYYRNQLLYVGIGPDWGQHKEIISNGTRSEDFIKWVIAPRLVGGAEQRICGKLILKEEFSFAWYDQYTVSHTRGISVQHDPRLSTFMVSAGYLF